MRRVSNEPRQVRKEAAVVMRSVCCGVPGLFFLGRWKLPFLILIFFDFFLPADQETNILPKGDKFLIPSNCP